MRYPSGLTALVLLAGCHSKSEPPQAQPSSEAYAPSAAGSIMPTPASTASDPDPTKAAALWLDRQTEPHQKGRYAPRDACGKLPGARAFREKLAAAVLARDADAVAAMADPSIKLDFAGDNGRARLLARLGESDGKLWHALAALLPLGCAADAQGGITIPWIFAQDLGDIARDDAMLVAGADVPLHSTSSADSAPKQHLSWGLVTLDKGWLADKPFQQVTTQGGTPGYVETGKLRSVLDYRLLATRRGETWKISALIAGD
jgi:hypothetical protein